MPASRANFHRLFTGFLNVLKAAPESALDDLADALDIRTEPDVGNDPHRRPGSAELNIGREQSADGDGGARMVKEFGDFKRGDGLTEAYAQLADELDDVKKAVKSIADVVARAFGKSGFPENESEGEHDDTKDDKDEAEKARRAAQKGKDALTLQVMSVPQLMGTLLGTSRSAAPSLATPPDMMAGAVAKAVSISDRIDSAGLSAEHNVAALTILQAMGAESQGLLPRGTTQAHLSRAPLEVRDLFIGA